MQGSSGPNLRVSAQIARNKFSMVLFLTSTISTQACREGVKPTGLLRKIGRADYQTGRGLFVKTG